MQLPAFDYSHMAWDAWRAFHVVHPYNAFVQFDTGELIVCARNWGPDFRRVYKELNLQIVTTEEHDCPRFFIPGAADKKPVPKAHLNHSGQQYLLLDLDHKRAVSIGPWLTKTSAPELVPERFLDSRSVAAYYAGPQAVPVGSPITRRYPQPLTRDQRQHVGELADACKVWLEMQPDPSALVRESRDVQTKVSYFVDTPFSGLTMAQRVAIGVRGFNMIVREENPWLTFE